MVPELCEGPSSWGIINAKQNKHTRKRGAASCVQPEKEKRICRTEASSEGVERSPSPSAGKTMVERFSARLHGKRHKEKIFHKSILYRTFLIEKYILMLVILINSKQLSEAWLFCVDNAASVIGYGSDVYVSNLNFHAHMSIIM